MRGTEEWKKQKRASIKKKIEQLAGKVVLITGEVKKFGPRLRRRGMSTHYAPRNGIIRNFHRGAVQSLVCTRKKIYALQKEMKSL